ncbi:MAG TPA: hypothetical protein VN969_06135 [Streptosporangiaceae bacterium]|nr:hypothetical protein [Streptosporangiaceae bacterium]
MEWAWQGKAPEDRGYRLLSSSTGDISARNFEEILDRFAPGTLDKLPEVTVSYVPGADSAGYISMAFHEEPGGLDRLGRDVTFTRFFCVPYRRLAAGAVRYLAMYEGFERIRLPDAAAPPFNAELSRSVATIPGAAARALPVAELLLTGNPVCIVDAESTTTFERLSFIDTVMSLLPYGMRAEMAAATWAKSTYRLHKFRLFFSESPRRTADSGLEDHLVRWGPDAMAITRARVTRVPAEFAAEYREWLQQLLDGPSVITDLAQETTARVFKAADIDQMLDAIHAKQQKRWWSRPPKRREIAVREDMALAPAPVRRPDPERAKAVRRDVIEGAINAIASILNHPARDAADVQPYLDLMREELGRGEQLSGEARERYRARIEHYRLLGDHLPIAKDKKAAGFYRVLLRVIFGEKISYLDYCEVEEMLSGKAPGKPLVQAIDEMLGADHDADPRVLFIVRCLLSKGRHQKSGFGPMQLLGIVTNLELRADHAELLWAATISALEESRPAEIEQAVLPLLRERGFLALELQARAPMDLAYQVNALIALLRVVYRNKVDRDDILDIFTGSRRHYPTVALLLAVSRLALYEDFELMISNFIFGLAGSQQVPDDAREGLAELGFELDDNDEIPVTVPADGGGVTLMEIPTSRTDAIRYMGTMKQADPPRERKKFIRRLLNPIGEFAISNEKSHNSDER